MRDKNNGRLQESPIIYQYKIMKEGCHNYPKSNCDRPVFIIVKLYKFLSTV